MQSLGQYLSSLFSNSKASQSLQPVSGLHLIISSIVIISASVLFGFIAENVMHAGWLTIIDTQLTQWLQARNTPINTTSMLILTNLHDPIIISVIVALMALYLIWKKRFSEALTVTFIVQGGMLLNLLVKQLFRRPRPEFEQPLVTLTTYSFPSGHVVANTLFYSVLALLMIAHSSSSMKTAGIFLAASIMIVLVAFSRLYLGAHYLSDVLAAFLESLIWFTLCLTAIQTYRFYHEKSRSNNKH